MTLRQMYKVAEDLETSFYNDEEELDPSFADDLERFIRGAITNTTELIQTKRDLGRTQLAERIQLARRAGKNRSL